MELLYIAIGIMICVLIFKVVIEPNIINKKVYEMLRELETDEFLLTPCKGRNYDFTLENDEILMLIKILHVPKNSCVTINSKYTWRLSWGGSSKKLGRVYPKNRYLNEIIPFLKEIRKDEKKVLKVIMIYPNTEKVLRYLNESELDVVTVKDMPYGYKVATYASFVQEFNDIINIK
ncbi:MAG TPA: hypothetical protein GXZ48_07920 [Acholeplasmataceae bacterium]|nr:hypothetical protein [Acholeplasmataceae bacterium]